MLKSFVAQQQEQEQSTRRRTNITNSSTGGGGGGVLLIHVRLWSTGRCFDSVEECSIPGNQYNNDIQNETDYQLEQVPTRKRRKKYNHKHAQVCYPVYDAQNYKACKVGRNGFSLDGQHGCSESLNGRLNSGIACLIQCLYPPSTTITTSDANHDGGKDEDEGTTVHACANECNDR